MRKNGSRTPWTNILMLAFVALSALLMVQCSLDNPGLPSWDLKFALTFSTQRFGLDSLVSRPSELKEGGGIDTLEGGLLKFTFSDTIDSVVIADSLLEMESEDTTDYSVFMEDVILPPSDASQARLPISDIIPGFTDDGYYTIDTLLIPDESSEVEVDPFQTITTVHCITPGGGELTIEVNNNTPLDWERINIAVANADANGEPEIPVLGVIVFTDMPQMSARTRTISLDDKTLKRDLLLTITGYGPGQGDKYLLSTDGLDINVSFGTLTCDYVRDTYIPRQEPIYDIDTIGLEDEDDWLVRAHITYGVIQVQMKNRSETDDSVYITIPHFFSYNDTLDTLRFDLFLASSQDPVRSVIDTTFFLGADSGTAEYRQDYLMTLDLPENYHRPDPEDQFMEVHTKVIPLGRFDAQGDPMPVTVSISDSVEATIIVETFDFEWVYGIAKDKTIEIERQRQVLDFWEYNPNLQKDLGGALKLDDAGLMVDLTGSIYNSPAKLVINVLAINNILEDRDSATFVRFLAPGQQMLFIGGPNDPGENRITDLFNTFPDIIVIDGEILIGRDHFAGSPYDPYQPYPLSKDDIFFGTLSLEAPLQFRIVRQAPIHAVMDRMGGGDTTEWGEIEDSPLYELPLSSITMVSHIKNSLPVGGSLYILAGHFTTDSIKTAADYAEDSLVYDNLNLFNLIDPPLRLRPPVIDGDRPDTSRLRIDTVMTIMDEAAIDVLTQDILFLRQVLVLDRTIGGVSAYEDDNVEVTITAEIEYRVNEEGD